MNRKRYGLNAVIKSTTGSAVSWQLTQICSMHIYVTSNVVQLWV